MAYNSKINNVKTPVDNLIFNGVSSMMNKIKSDIWSGTMTDLAENIYALSSKDQKVNLPKSPSTLRVVLNRIINRLRNNGFGVRFIRSTDRNRTRLVRFTK